MLREKRFSYEYEALSKAVGFQFVTSLMYGPKEWGHGCTEFKIKRERERERERESQKKKKDKKEKRLESVCRGSCRVCKLRQLPTVINSHQLRASTHLSL